MLRIEGAAENNLSGFDVDVPGGITAVIGVSGSGKSSLVFDTIYREARRRFLTSLSANLSAAQLQPARVRAINGLRPAVAVSQNVVNRNPNSTVSTAAGIHPFLRVLYARCATRRCTQCAQSAVIVPREAQFAELRSLAAKDEVKVLAPVVRLAEGTHSRLLARLAERFGTAAVEVDRTREGNAEWTRKHLNPDVQHTISVTIGTADSSCSERDLRQLLDAVRALGCVQVTFRTARVERTLSYAALCASCGARLSDLRPQDFRGANDNVTSYELAGLTLPALQRLDVVAAAHILAEADLPPWANNVVEQIRRRLRALESLGLGYLSLDRPSPTLSRGEAQRLRLSVILINDVEELLHIVDEPAIGLAPAQVGVLLDQLGRLAGPVVLVEHDRNAVADADHVIEVGPAAGRRGGRIVFTGTPAQLWTADTLSGRWFSGRSALHKLDHSDTGGERISVTGAHHNNLRDIDCAIPLSAMTVVTGPSGTGKTTLVRDVLVASLKAGKPVGCRELDTRPLRPITVDQSPIGANPRSNPATYTGLANRIRTVFASTTGQPASMFSFNRPEGACQECSGMGAIEVRLPFLASEWVTCATCNGRRFALDVLNARATLADDRQHCIAEVFNATADEATALFSNDARASRILAALVDVGLGYLPLGQPAPTLSGGEAQRVKLAKQLAAVGREDLLYLDEPTTGLHPGDLPQLVGVLRRLVDRGCTLIVVEHNSSVVALADWIIELGPGSGPDGGQVVYSGPPRAHPTESPTARSTPREGRPVRSKIEIRGASVNNLRDITVEIPKRRLTAVVGVSGSGKSSLVRDVLASEAERRLLECLSMYERQSVREGPQSQVDSVTGLGPTLTVGSERRLFNPRSTVGTVTELSAHLGALLAYAGQRACPECGGPQRRVEARSGSAWRCAHCRTEGPAAEPDDFSPAHYEAACLHCHGMGRVPQPRIDRLIAKPDKPICGGAMYSPGFYPRGYLCKPPNGGYWALQGLAKNHGFDPFQTPWNAMSEQAREAFLFGEEDVELPPEITRSAFGGKWQGVYRIVGNWDVGGLYTDRLPCPECAGGKLRPLFLDVVVAGMNRQALFGEPIAEVLGHLERFDLPDKVPAWAAWSLDMVSRRLAFLVRTGLSYLNLDRLTATLSAGEAQRVKLASLLGSDLTGMTVLLDEPSRGLHPREVEVLGDTLTNLVSKGNTVVVVDHDPRLFAKADNYILLGPGAGPAGGEVVAAGPPSNVRTNPTARDLLDPPVPSRATTPRIAPRKWMTVVKPTENNLMGDDVAIPLGVLTGMCGVSGSGKSTLAIDIVARALTPRQISTSVASTPVDPGEHERIDGAPSRVIHTDQSRTGITTPGAFLGLLGPLRKQYAHTAVAQAAGLGADDLTPACDGCKGKGAVRMDMGFLSPVQLPCDVCDATGYRAEVRRIEVRGHTLPELERQPLFEVLALWDDLDTIANPLRTALDLGLGYLTLTQTVESLSGGERQRLKLVKAMARTNAQPTMYILDEPTAGLHATDVARLITGLDGLVRRGHSVLAVDHDPAFLACCDWLIELGPGAGPNGGRVVATGTPEMVAAADTPTAPYLAEVLR